MKKKSRVKKKMEEKNGPAKFLKTLQKSEYFSYVEMRGSAIVAHFSEDIRRKETIKEEKGEIIFGSSEEKISPQIFDCELYSIEEERMIFFPQ